MTDGVSAVEALKKVIDETGVSLGKSLKFTAIATGIGIIITLIQAWKRHQEELIQEAQANAEAYAKTSASISDYANEAGDILASIESGSMSSEEEYSARLRLIEIEGELTSAYGSEAEALNLLTMNAQQAADAFDRLAQSKANSYITENESSIAEAFEEMYTDKNYTAGTIKWNSASDNVKSKIKEIVDSYEGASLQIEKRTGSSLETARIQFEGQAEEYKDFLSYVATEFRELGSYLAADGLNLDNLFYTTAVSESTFSGSFEKEAKRVGGIIDKYGKQAVEGMNATITASDDYSLALQQMQEAEEMYASAVSGNFESTTDRVEAVTSAHEQIRLALTNFDSIDFDGDEAVKQYLSGFAEDLQDNAKQLEVELDIAAITNGGWLNKDILPVVNSLKELINETGSNYATDILNLGLGSDDWNAANGPLERQQVLYLNLKKACESYGTSIENLVPVLSKYGILIGSSSMMVADASRAYTSAKGEIEAINSAIAEQADGNSVSLETYEKLIAVSSEYADCVKNEGGVMQLDTEAIKERAKIRSDEKQKIIDANKALAQEKYSTNAAKIKEYEDNLKTLSETERQHLESLKTENEALEVDINKYGMMAAAIREATSARQAWINAQGESQPGDSFTDAADAIEHIREVLQGSTPTRGDVGTTKYKAAIDFVIPEETKKKGETEIKKYVNGLRKILKFNGNEIVDINVDEIFRQLKTGADAILEQNENGEWLVKEGTTLDDFAKKLNVTEEMARSLVGMLNRNGWNLDFGEEETTLTDFANSAEKAVETLELMNNLDEFDIVIDVSTIEDTQDKIDRLEQTIIEAQRMRAKFGVDSSEAEQAASIIRYCIQQKNLLANKTILSIDTTTVEGEMGPALKLLQDYVNKKTELEEAIKLGEPTGDIKSELDGIVQQLEGVSTSVATAFNGIEESFSLDNIDTTSIDALITKINEIDSEKLKVTLGINDDAVIEYSAEDKDAEVIYSVNDDDVANYNPPDLHRTVYYHKKEVDDDAVVNGTANASGTANAFGTARASGDWGTAKPGRTLVGELGKEIVVNPHTGRWYTVGENGAEFVDMPGGAIVFNHLQTRHLLENGHVTSRGRAMASGNAASNIPLTGGTGGWKPSVNSSSSVIYGGGSGAGGAVVIPIQPGFTTSSKSYSFEDMYNWHQHILAMEQESYQEYLEWLDKAFREAYDRGEYEHDDFYKYEEEVFEGLKELFEDNLKDIEFQIDSLLRGNGNEKEIINLYNQMIIDIDKQIEAARQRGLGDNDEYIQELLGQRYDYEDEIADLQDEATDNAKDAVKDLVDYRIDMLKKELENERDNLNDRLSEIKDFYDEQKELLQDVYDEEKYLEDQKEKRKAKSDIEEELARLEFDDSAWAQKRRLELQEELEEANKDLADFERDKALENAQDMFDKLYEKQEEQIQSEIDAIEDKLNDPHALYNQALKDIQNNTLALYEEMVEYNNKYQTGNPEDVKEMWDEAKASLDAFLSTFGHAYKDIVLVPSPSGYASGTSNATPGIHAIDELGEEYVFTSNDGTRYRMFSGGEKVLNAKATNFLYNFATSGGNALVSIFEKLVRTSIPNKIDSSSRVSEINMGDVIIQGNTNENTVSEIRRAKRNEMQWILKEFNKMNKR